MEVKHCLVNHAAEQSSGDETAMISPQTPFYYVDCIFLRTVFTSDIYLTHTIGSKIIKQIAYQMSDIPIKIKKIFK